MCENTIMKLIKIVLKRGEEIRKSNKGVNLTLVHENITMKLLYAINIQK
jgi:hypothetical protein